MKNENRKNVGKPYRIEVADDKLWIYVREEKKPNKWALGALLLMPMIIMGILIGFFVYLAPLGEGVPFGFIISCVIGVMVAGYLLKLFLWNKYGQEVFLIQRDSFVTYHDYKFFRDNFRSFNASVSGLSVMRGRNLLKAPEEYISRYKDEKRLFRIVFRVKGENIIPGTGFPFDAIMKIRETIMNWKED